MCESCGGDLGRHYATCPVRLAALIKPRTPVLCEARCESGKGAGTCPTCGAVYKR